MAMEVIETSGLNGGPLNIKATIVLMGMQVSDSDQWNAACIIKGCIVVAECMHWLLRVIIFT